MTASRMCRGMCRDRGPRRQTEFTMPWRASHAAHDPYSRKARPIAEPTHRAKCAVVSLTLAKTASHCSDGPTDESYCDDVASHPDDSAPEHPCAAPGELGAFASQATELRSKTMFAGAGVQNIVGPVEPSVVSHVNSPSLPPDPAP